MRSKSKQCSLFLSDEILLALTYVFGMSTIFPSPPEMGASMSATNASPEARAFLALRRSTGKAGFCEPGPSRSELDEILYVASRVRDHRRVSPWRFIGLQGDSRSKLGDDIAAIYKSDHPEASSEEVEVARALPQRAPTVVAVIATLNHTHKTPVHEQTYSVGAVCYNLLLAANAAGWAGGWLTEWISEHKSVHGVLGLSDTESIAGFIYLGTATHDPQERMRPDMTGRITYWGE